MSNPATSKTITRSPAFINTPETIAKGLNFVQVDPINLYQALLVQQQIWPNNPVDADYLNKVNDPNDSTNASWLAYWRNNLIGLTGVYTFDPDESGYDGGNSIWMDWFGILPEYRGAYYGENILKATITYAKRLQLFKYFRLDTADFDERRSTKLYNKVMQLREDYTAEPMPAGHRGLIYSYSLDDSPIKPWNNQLLDLARYGAAEIAVN